MKISRRDAAQRLDIPLEMAARHGIPKTLSEAEMDDLVANPPAWLLQSRANRTGKRAVWVDLECAICNYAEKARPKKWWPTHTFLYCEHHAASEIPAADANVVRVEMEGIGTRFVAVVDTPVD